jgi:hypothetical protein
MPRFAALRPCDLGVDHATTSPLPSALVQRYCRVRTVKGAALHLYGGFLPVTS